MLCVVLIFILFHSKILIWVKQNKINSSNSFFFRNIFSFHSGKDERGLFLDLFGGAETVEG